MIINSDKKYVFVCVPKTATTSLYKFLKIAHKLPMSSNKEWTSKKWHWPMSSIINDYRNLNFDKYYKFAFHRNPWDRLVSSFIEFTSDEGHRITWSKKLCNYKMLKNLYQIYQQANGKMKYIFNQQHIIHIVMAKKLQILQDDTKIYKQTYKKFLKKLIITQTILIQDKNIEEPQETKIIKNIILATK